MGIFTETGRLVKLSMHLMRILAVGYRHGCDAVSVSVIRAKNTMTPMWISLITTVAIRVPLAYGICLKIVKNTWKLPSGRNECVFIFPAVVPGFWVRLSL